MGSLEDVQVTVRYKGLTKEIRGGPNAVLQELFQFFNQIQPQLEIISRISLTVDELELLQETEGIFAITPEGLVLTKGLDQLSDREIVLVLLAKARLAQTVGKDKKAELQSSELVSATMKSTGTVAGRLSELAREELVERVGKGAYRITTLGLHRFREDILPKLKATQ